MQRSTITLDDDLAKWLVDAGIARTVQSIPKPIPRNEEKSK